MKLKIERERLLKPLGNVSSIVEKRQTLPILGNVYLKLSGDELALTGTDLETEVIARISGVDGEAGECTVAARKLHDICRALPEDAELEVQAKADKVVVRSNRSRFTLQALPAADFPRVEAQQWETGFTIPQNALQKLLERTAFAMAQQDVRYYLNGCLLEVSGAGLRVVATDGHRLAKSEIKLGTEVAVKRQVIVPRKAVLELVRFLNDSDEEVAVELNPNHIRVSGDNWVFTSKLIDGRFPDYEKVIPKGLDIHLILNREMLHDLLARTAILTNEKFRGVRLALSTGRLVVSAHNPDQEEASDEMQVNYTGESVEIGFNVSYLMDALKALSTEDIDFGLQDPSSSCTLTAPKDTSALYLVMPMRL